MKEKKIFIVENNADIKTILKNQMQRQLEAAGYVTRTVGSCEKAREVLKTNEYIPDLILVDEILPDGNGISLCREIRELTLKPIIFTNCRREQKIIVEALESGADDYMIKPMHMEVLMAKIASHLRRSMEYTYSGEKAGEKEGVQYFQQFAVDRRNHSVWRVNQCGVCRELIHLSPIEYKLLLSFIEHPNELLTYEKLYRYIWKVEDLGDVRTVMVHVSNLRKKIDYLGNDTIHTVRGEGYLFKDN